MPQSFNDGNLDVTWRRGVVMTAKEEGLWLPTTKVPPEDVRHLKICVQEFRLAHAMQNVQDVESCAPCMARWIVHYASDGDSVAAPPSEATGSGGW